MAIDHIITYPIIYSVLLYLQDWRKYYRLKSVSFFFRHPVQSCLVNPVFDKNSVTDLDKTYPRYIVCDTSIFCVIFLWSILYHWIPVNMYMYIYFSVQPPICMLTQPSSVYEAEVLAQSGDIFVVAHAM